MVYSSPINLVSDSVEMMADPPASNKTLRVYYNDIALDTIAGPVPLVNISTDYNTTNAGISQSLTTRATINGKILRTTYYNPETSPSGTGTAILLDAVGKLRDLFKCNNGIFSIKCNNAPIIEGSGVLVKSAKFDKSNDNWFFSSDYSVELEYNEPLPDSLSSEPLIKNGSDAWSLEPIEDYVYMNMNKNNGVNQKSEYHNPKLGASGPPSNIRVPPNDTNARNAGTVLNFITLPQFKLSRTVSAIGLSNTANTGTCGSGIFPAYHQAKKWVEKQLAKSFKEPIDKSHPTISSSNIAGVNNFDKLFLYNHFRNIDFNHMDGSYKVSDTWLAMPTGISYLEDYTIDSSTDDKNIKTVRVQGNIKGLSISSLPIMSGSVGLIPEDNGVIDLKPYNTTSTQGSFAVTPNKLDSNSPANNHIGPHKYLNAYSGWINDIKPFLYRRASSVVNSLDRNTQYVINNINPHPPVNNPIYSYERLLNIIPISTSETLDTRKGSISYSYEFSNKFSLFSGVLSENISISNNMPTDIINEAFVIGRHLGPVLQYMGTTTASTKGVTIELVVLPPSSTKGYLLTNPECPLYIYGPTYSGVKLLVSGLRPFGSRVNIFGNMNRSAATGNVQLVKDDTSWNPTEGRFVKTVEWIYQPCDLNYSLFKEL